MESDGMNLVNGDRGEMLCLNNIMSPELRGSYIYPRHEKKNHGKK